MPIALEVESNHAWKVDFERKTEEKQIYNEVVHLSALIT